MDGVYVVRLSVLMEYNEADYKLLDETKLKH